MTDTESLYQHLVEKHGFPTDWADLPLYVLTQTHVDDHKTSDTLAPTHGLEER